MYCLKFSLVLLNFLCEKHFARLNYLKLIVDVLQMTFVLQWAAVRLLQLIVLMSKLICLRWSSAYKVMVVSGWGWVTPWRVVYRGGVGYEKMVRIIKLPCCVQMLGLLNRAYNARVVWKLLFQAPQRAHQVGHVLAGENWVFSHWNWLILSEPP